MGILPLQFKPGETAESLGLTGEEVYSIEGLPAAIAGRFAGGRELTSDRGTPGAGAGAFLGDGPDRHSSGDPVL